MRLFKINHKNLCVLPILILLSIVWSEMAQTAQRIEIHDHCKVALQSMSSEEIRTRTLELVRERDLVQVESDSYLKIVNQIVELNMSLVPATLGRYGIFKAPRFRKDLLQAGIVGLIKASRKVSYNKLQLENSFSTYATHHILGHALNEIWRLQRSGHAHASNGARKVRNNYYQAIELLRVQGYESPNFEQIAKAVNQISNARGRFGRSGIFVVKKEVPESSDEAKKSPTQVTALDVEKAIPFILAKETGAADFNLSHNEAIAAHSDGVYQSIFSESSNRRVEESFLAFKNELLREGRALNQGTRFARYVFILENRYLPRYQEKRALSLQQIAEAFGVKKQRAAQIEFELKKKFALYLRENYSELLGN